MSNYMCILTAYKLAFSEIVDVGATEQWGSIAGTCHDSCQR